VQTQPELSAGKSHTESLVIYTDSRATLNPRLPVNLLAPEDMGKKHLRRKDLRMNGRYDDDDDIFNVCESLVRAKDVLG
jgi:hypothetical protein